MTNSPRLDEIAVRIGSDRSSRTHDYARLYERLFGHRQDTPIRLAEIDAGKGDSLRLWQEYFRKGEFIDIDVNGKQVTADARTQVFHGSPSDEQFLRHVGESAGPFDLVIDNGTHRWADQIKSFRQLFTFVQPGGYYVVEAAHTSYWSKYRDGAVTTMAYFQGLVDEINMHGKSGYGDPRNDPEYASFADTLTKHPHDIEAISFYKSVIIIQKKSEAATATTGASPMLAAEPAASSIRVDAAPLRIAIATRSMIPFLYDASTELLGLGQFATDKSIAVTRQKVMQQDNFTYFRDLLQVDADWIISLDEDAFVLKPTLLVDLVRYMAEHGYVVCGMPDGGVVPIRRHNPAACNAFFNIFDMRKVRPVWQDWGRVMAARHRPEFEKSIAPFARRSVFAFDHFERYYGAFFSLLEAGERFLYLDAEEWQDKVSTLLKTVTGEPLLLHCWYTRHWERSYHTRRRIRAALDYARVQQGLAPLPHGSEET